MPTKQWNLRSSRVAFIGGQRSLGRQFAAQNLLRTRSGDPNLYSISHDLQNCNQNILSDRNLLIGPAR